MKITILTNTICIHSNYGHSICDGLLYEPYEIYFYNEKLDYLKLHYTKCNNSEEVIKVINKIFEKLQIAEVFS